jgi:hypothetical protein
MGHLRVRACWWKRNYWENSHAPKLNQRNVSTATSTCWRKKHKKSINASADLKNSKLCVSFSRKTGQLSIGARSERVSKKFDEARSVCAVWFWFWACGPSSLPAHRLVAASVSYPSTDFLRRRKEEPCETVRFLYTCSFFCSCQNEYEIQEKKKHGAFCFTEH